MDCELDTLAEQLGLQLKGMQLTVATAESCTGGWIAQAITSIPGSSAWFDRGFVTYSNAAKSDMLGVKTATLVKYGAVSAETAAEMVSGALAHSHADIAVSVTGIAGPDGGSVEKPVGTVYVAWQRRHDPPKIERLQLVGDRREIRQATVMKALNGIETLLQAPKSG